MDSLFDKKFKCPICEADFTSKKVKRSCIRAKIRHRDFHVEYQDESPIYYGVICCQVCGFAQFESDFSRKLSPKNQTHFFEKITSKWQNHNYSGKRTLEDAIKVHKVALASYLILDTQANIMGKLFLRLKWFYKELGNQEEEMKYAVLAKDMFIKHFEEGTTTEEEEELQIIYLIAELLRELGEVKESVRWFDRVIQHENIYKNRVLKQYANEQRELSMEAYRLLKDKE